VRAAAEGFSPLSAPWFYGSFVAARSPRTLAGLRSDGTLLLVTVDGRRPGWSAGVTLPEAARVMRALGAPNALNLDGGGSTAMAVRGRVVSRPSDPAGERPVSDALVVLRMVERRFAMASLAPDAPTDGHGRLEAVTAALVALHERYHGRRPVTARTMMMGDDMLACLFGDVYTDVEKTMIELQRQALVHETRREFQRATERRFIAEVERITGRRVSRFISTHHVGPDLELELFMLEPATPA
jgi:uncharacterized protein YbcI